MKTVRGKYIWIIGASSGIGSALARTLAAQGAILMLSARNLENLAAVKADIGAPHTIWPLDVTNPKAFEMAAADIQQSVPRIDSVIYLAGHYHPMALDQLDLLDCRKIVDTNLNGALNFIHAVLPVMLEQKSGQMAICASIAGLQCWRGRTFCVRDRQT